MALKSIIYKIAIELADMDRDYYDSMHLTLAKHPSETDQRLLVRILAYLLNAHPDLKFGKGLSNEEEAVLWQIDYSDNIEHWIELGQIESKRVKKACHRAKQVTLYCYGQSAETWWKLNQQNFNDFKNLTVKQFSVATTEPLLKHVARNMELQCSIVDGQMWLTVDETPYLVETINLKPAP